MNTIPTSPPYGTIYQCLTCNKQYKREATYLKHQQAVATYNTIPGDCYILPVNATSEFKKTIVFMIKERLKLHFRTTGRQSITYPCSKSIFCSFWRTYSPFKFKKTRVQMYISWRNSI